MTDKKAPIEAGQKAYFYKSTALPFVEVTITGSREVETTTCEPFISYDYTNHRGEKGSAIYAYIFADNDALIRQMKSDISWLELQIEQAEKQTINK